MNEWWCDYIVFLWSVCRLCLPRWALIRGWKRMARWEGRTSLRSRRLSWKSVSNWSTLEGPVPHPSLLDRDQCPCFYNLYLVVWFWIRSCASYLSPQHLGLVRTFLWLTHMTWIGCAIAGMISTYDMPLAFDVLGMNVTKQEIEEAVREVCANKKTVLFELAFHSLLGFMCWNSQSTWMAMAVCNAPDEFCIQEEVYWAPNLFGMADGVPQV